MICTGTVSSRPSPVPVMTYANCYCDISTKFMWSVVFILDHTAIIYFPHLYVKHLSLISVWQEYTMLCTLCVCAFITQSTLPGVTFWIGLLLPNWICLLFALLWHFTTGSLVERESTSCCGRQLTRLSDYDTSWIFFYNIFTTQA